MFRNFIYSRLTPICFGGLFALVLNACSPAQQTQAISSANPAADALGAVGAVVSCESLQQFDINAIGGAGSTISKAKSSVQNGVDVCVVEGNMAPTVGFKVVLPVKNWTQRYLQLGCGGLCGMINLNVGAADGCAAVDGQEFVLATTDMGHSGMGGDFGNDPQKQVDFAYRGVHITALAAKALIQQFYGQAPAYSYFDGCSDGGREALVEAQRYPEDFDGILAGAPAMNFSVQNSFYHGWQAMTNTAKDGKAILHAKDMPVLYKAALAQCDAIDGLKDELISDPRACDFDPAITQCKNGQTTDCLTELQVDAARKLYQGPKDAKTGTSLTLGGPQLGSELAWIGVFVPRPGSEMIFSNMIAEDALRYLVFENNPGDAYQVSDLRFDLATFDKIRVKNQLFNSTNPDLRAFNQAGGKLMLWHGWSDPHISPLNTIRYYEAVGDLMTTEQASFMRMYLFPGMYHCDDGTGPHDVDLLTPMMAWVEKGLAPEAIVAFHPGNVSIPDKPMMGAPQGKPPKDGEAHSLNKPKIAGSALAKMSFKVDYIKRSRPVYPYPYVASYVGSGDVNDADNFKGIKNTSGSLDYPWAGEQFFNVDQQATCAIKSNQVVCPPLNPEVKQWQK